MTFDFFLFACSIIALAGGLFILWSAIRIVSDVEEREEKLEKENEALDKKKSEITDLEKDLGKRARQEVKDDVMRRFRSVIEQPADVRALHVIKGGPLTVFLSLSKSTRRIKIDWFVDEKVDNSLIVQGEMNEVQMFREQKAYSNSIWGAVGPGAHSFDFSLSIKEKYARSREYLVKVQHLLTLSDADLGLSDNEIPQLAKDPAEGLSKLRHWLHSQLDRFQVIEEFRQLGYSRANTMPEEFRSTARAMVDGLAEEALTGGDVQ